MASLSASSLKVSLSIFRLPLHHGRFGALHRFIYSLGFLVKGGAGTGKTLVLPEVLKRIGRSPETDGEPGLDLGLEEQASAMFLTYTTTLAKYDLYLSRMMEIDSSGLKIETVDKQLYRELKKVDAVFGIDYGFDKKFAAEFNSTDFLDNELLVKEMEDFIFGYAVSETEYLYDMIPRKGMKIPLNRSQRGQVWEIVCKLRDRMIRDGAVSRNLAANLILEHMDSVSQKSVTDYIFIDESQDLPPVILMMLKRISGKSLLMAGDVDQSIYGVGSPYARANIDLRGNTRILRTNFRNPLPIHRLAGTYRLSSERISYDAETHRNRDFNFADGGTVRLSQMHSSKGLDFPVVLLFLPYLPGNDAYAEDVRDMLQRNLVYVSLTRAMDSLNIFMKPNPSQKALSDLQAALGDFDFDDG